MDPQHLERLTRDTDEQHREAMRTMHDDLRDLHAGTRHPELAQNRRDFLSRAASSTTAIVFGSATLTLPMLLGARAPAAAAQETGFTKGTSAGTSAGTASGPATTAAPNSVLPDADITLVRFAESVERAAAAMYEMAVGTHLFTPPVDELCRLFGRHHIDHADAHLAILSADAKGGKLKYGGKPADANPVLMAELGRQLTSATSANAVLRVAHDLEEAAAATYLVALGALVTQSVAATVATILPIESQHAVVLGQALELATSDYLPSLQRELGAKSPDTYALR